MNALKLVALAIGLMFAAGYAALTVRGAVCAARGEVAVATFNGVGVVTWAACGRVSQHGKV